MICRDTPIIRNWHQQRHRQHGLAADAGHRKMQHGLDAHHGDGAGRDRQMLQRRDERRDDGVDDASLIQRNEDCARSPISIAAYAIEPKPLTNACAVPPAHEAPATPARSPIAKNSRPSDRSPNRA